jgi:hypothetical protein
MSRSNHCLFSHFKSAYDGGLRNNKTIIPEDAESELLPTTVLFEKILVLIPVLSGRKRVLQPGFPTYDSLHKQFDAAKVRREWSENRWEGVLAF